MIPDKDQAEKIILGILRQSQSGLGKTKLYKAFWLAHLYYSLQHTGYLSDWPIVRMPNGPGIHLGRELLNELSQSGRMTQDEEWIGPFREKRCRLVPEVVPTETLSVEAVDAIRSAVTFVESRTATELSQMSHDYSRSWRELPDGTELNIYSDLIPEDEYMQNSRDAEHAMTEYHGLFQ